MHALAFWFFFTGNFICAIAAISHGSLGMTLFNGGTAVFMLTCEWETLREQCPYEDDDLD